MPATVLSPDVLQLRRGGKHDRVAERAGQSRLGPVPQHVAAHVHADDQIRAELGRGGSEAVGDRSRPGEDVDQDRLLAEETRHLGLGEERARRRSACRGRREPRAARAGGHSSISSSDRGPGWGSIGSRSQVTPPTITCGPKRSQNRATASAPTTSPPPPMPSTIARRLARNAASSLALMVAGVLGRGKARPAALSGGLFSRRARRRRPCRLRVRSCRSRWLPARTPRPRSRACPRTAAPGRSRPRRGSRRSPSGPSP